MKTMTRKQIGGPCDQEFHAETFDEMVKKSQQHGIEMAEKGYCATVFGMSTWTYQLIF